MTTALSFTPMNGQESLLQARQWDAVAGTVVTLQPNNAAVARRARLHISYGQLSQAGCPWCARCWEEEIVDGIAPVEWLLTSEQPIASVQDALGILMATPETVSGMGCV